MEGLFFAIGFLLGGVFGVLIMCLLQINRLGRKCFLPLSKILF